MIEEQIDIVVEWVDGNDPEWQKEYKKYRPDTVFDAKRYRDWGLLRYWFRGVEQFAPWVNKVFFVTCGQLPEWLNLEHPKLVHIKHEDYIPKQYLPTFNSSAIELFINRIPGLSEKFLFFNDDFYLTAPVMPERFFQNGLPCDMPIEGGYEALHNGFHQIFFNNIAFVNEHFSKREVIKHNPQKWFNYKYGVKNFQNLYFLAFNYFVNFVPFHLVQPFLKSTYEEVWECYGTELERRTMTRFRGNDNVTQYLQRAWQLCSGKFHPYNPLKESKCIFLSDSNVESTAKIISSSKYSMLCLNDTVWVNDFERDCEILKKSFEELLPKRSKYEKY